MTDAVKMLKPIPIERVLEDYSIYAGMVVVPSSPSARHLTSLSPHDSLGL
jgi:hypothetical protein